MIFSGETEAQMADLMAQGFRAGYQGDRQRALQELRGKDAIPIQRSGVRFAAPLLYRHRRQHGRGYPQTVPRGRLMSRRPL